LDLAKCKWRGQRLAVKKNDIETRGRRGMESWGPCHGMATRSCPGCRSAPMGETQVAPPPSDMNEMQMEEKERVG
jgi:hypothetical protein